LARITSFFLMILTIECAAIAKLAGAQEHELPAYLWDRGTGLPTSIFGSYVSEGEFIIYPFFEYSIDNNREYQPAQYGFGASEDFLAKYRSLDGALFLGYGLTDWLALEFEAAYMSTTFEKSPADTFSTPEKIKESGFGDIEGQIRWRWLKEDYHRPEMFSFLEITVPSQKSKMLIGDPDWDLKPGIGMVRGFSWGTMTLRTDLEYNRESSSLDVGETAVEYLKRLSPSWRLYAAIEGGEGGAPDEWSLISGVQWRISDLVTFKFDNSIGITSKATDCAPQVGLLFTPRLR